MSLRESDSEAFRRSPPGAIRGLFMCTAKVRTALTELYPGFYDLFWVFYRGLEGSGQPWPAHAQTLRHRLRAVGRHADHCDSCNAEASEHLRLKRCARCKVARYCSRECQAAAWKAVHKKDCRAPDATEEE
ncbi:hypothetical protein DFJ74DRAFT_707990 [Hyaloraphidium curvatum]|nr:hypothetical protein DFJ74DRAFT_707990 [Hyaloraphidium curvatum]